MTSVLLSNQALMINKFGHFTYREVRQFARNPADDFVLNHVSAHVF